MLFRSLKAYRALVAERDANAVRHEDALEAIGREDRQWAGLVAAMLTELIKRDDDRLAGDGYLGRPEVADYFGVTPATITAWGKDKRFPPPLGGWQGDGEKRHELRFWKPMLRVWRAMQHGVDPERAEKLLDQHAAMAEAQSNTVN